MIERNGIVVLGMHRSGTSVLMGMMEIAGIAVTKNPLQPNDWNPKGYFEAASLTSLLDEFLSVANSSWHDWRQLDINAVPKWRLQEFKARFLDILHEDFADNRSFAVKDPRLCRLAPIAVELVQAVNARPVIIIPLRYPPDVCASLTRRDSIPYKEGALIWLRHVIEAERSTRGLPRVFTLMNDLIECPGIFLARVSERLCLRLDLSSADTQSRLDEFVESGLVHHAVDEREASDIAIFHQMCLPLWRMLIVACKDGDGSLDYRMLDALYLEFDSKFK